MNRTSSVAIALIALLLIGGCLGANTGDSLTPASFTYPDGYDRSGITDASTAIEAHETTLDEPYRVEFTLKHLSDRGRSRVSGTIVADPRGERALLRTESVIAGQTNTVTEYRTGETTYVQEVSEDAFEYTARNSSFRIPVYPNRDDLVTMLGALQLNATEAYQSNDTRYVEYTVQNVTPSRMQTEIENARGTLIVDDEGRIHRMSVTFDQQLSGVEREVAFDYRTNTSNVTVERPNWVDKARDSAEE